jgi:mannose-6-phosphate isomerase-like protein (cupin superfamily)
MALLEDRMPNMERRSFLGLAMAALPFHRLAKSLQAAQPTIGMVAAGQDRCANSRLIHTAASALQVSPKDIQGALFVMEHDSYTGGPPRHLHRNEDEWFFVIEGEYLVEVGASRHRLKSGDSVLGPRKVPHAWAFVGGTPGWLLRAYSPAGKLKTLFAERNGRSPDSHYSADAAGYRAWGMELLGPPLRID